MEKQIAMEFAIGRQQLVLELVDHCRGLSRVGKRTTGSVQAIDRLA